MADGKIIVVENFSFEAPKTKEFIGIAKNLNVADKRVLLVMNDNDRNVLLSVRNIPNAIMAQAKDLNAYTLLNNDAIIVTEGSIDVINQF